MTLCGLLLAAGAGRRMGGPKALVRDPDGTSWLLRAVSVLREGGCDDVTVVLGASADEVLPLLADVDVRVVVADVVLLVDLPDVTADVVRRVAGVVTGPATLARAAYGGVPGHPVVLGREHWGPAAGAARGDRGARDYLASADVELVECGDLATGRDVDA
jgi:CTP:molybdopterin cytidylyltransferase MocA